MDGNAYEEGKRSYQRNKGKYSNPYEMSDPRYNEFDRGWSQGLRRSSEPLNREFEWDTEFGASQREEKKKGLKKCRK